MPAPDADLIVRLAAAWYGRRLDAADAEGLAAALAPLEAAMAAAARELPGMPDFSPTNFTASLERHAPEAKDA